MDGWSDADSGGGGDEVGAPVAIARGARGRGRGARRRGARGRETRGGGGGRSAPERAWIQPKEDANELDEGTTLQGLDGESRWKVVCLRSTGAHRWYRTWPKPFTSKLGVPAADADDPAAPSFWAANGWDQPTPKSNERGGRSVARGRGRAVAASLSESDAISMAADIIGAELRPASSSGSATALAQSGRGRGRGRGQTVRVAVQKTLAWPQTQRAQAPPSATTDLLDIDATDQPPQASTDSLANRGNHGTRRGRGRGARRGGRGRGAALTTDDSYDGPPGGEEDGMEIEPPSNTPLPGSSNSGEAPKSSRPKSSFQWATYDDPSNIFLKRAATPTTTPFPTAASTATLASALASSTGLSLTGKGLSLTGPRADTGATAGTGAIGSLLFGHGASLIAGFSLGSGQTPSTRAAPVEPQRAGPNSNPDSDAMTD